MSTKSDFKQGLYKFNDSRRIDIIKDRRLDHWDNEYSDQWLKWQGETSFAEVERILEGSKPSLALPIEYLT